MVPRPTLYTYFRSHSVLALSTVALAYAEMFSNIIQWIKRRKVVVLCLVFTFIVSGLIVNALELITLPLYFINKRWFRIINCKIVYLHWCGEWMSIDVFIIATRLK